MPTTQFITYLDEFLVKNQEETNENKNQVIIKGDYQDPAQEQYEVEFDYYLMNSPRLEYTKESAPHIDIAKLNDFINNNPGIDTLKFFDLGDSEHDKKLLLHLLDSLSTDASSNHMKHIDLRTSNFRDPEIQKALSSYLKRNKALSSITMQSLHGKDNYTLILDALRDHYGVTKIDLSGSKLGDELAGEIVMKLSEHCVAIDLDLSDNELSAEFVKSLDKAFDENLQLSKLNLANNLICNFLYLFNLVSKHQNKIEILDLQDRCVNGIEHYGDKIQTENTQEYFDYFCYENIVKITTTKVSGKVKRIIDPNNDGLIFTGEDEYIKIMHHSDKFVSLFKVVIERKSDNKDKKQEIKEYYALDNILHKYLQENFIVKIGEADEKIKYFPVVQAKLLNEKHQNKKYYNNLQHYWMQTTEGENKILEYYNNSNNKYKAFKLARNNAFIKFCYDIFDQATQLAKSTVIMQIFGVRPSSLQEPSHPLHKIHTVLSEYLVQHLTSEDMRRTFRAIKPEKRKILRQEVMNQSLEQHNELFTKERDIALGRMQGLHK